MSKEANNYTTKSNSTPLPTGKGVRLIISGGGSGGLFTARNLYGDATFSS